MTDAADGSGFGRARKARQPLAVRLGLSARFHAFCARVPGLKHIARAEGAALFDVVSGFVQGVSADYNNSRIDWAAAGVTPPASNATFAISSAEMRLNASSSK